MNLFCPYALQGNLKMQNYFEGWYYKQVTADLSRVWSIIPGISLSGKERHAFIQFIDGISGETLWFEYPLSSFAFDRKEMKIHVGESWFTQDSIHLNVRQNGQKIEGNLEFFRSVRYPSKFYSPGIMGWYSFVPFMECKHGIVSVTHQLKGTLSQNGQPVDFSGGRGYIEKDWGISFPESWIWIHCNHFRNDTASFTFSVAKIPWLGSFFIGHICFLHIDGRFYTFATYNGTRIRHLSYNDNLLVIVAENRRYQIEISVTPNISGHLKAPVQGKMSRIIKESIDSRVTLKLQDKNGHILFEETGTRAGFELSGKILQYFTA
jgi:tocopherol cyclase